MDEPTRGLGARARASYDSLLASAAAMATQAEDPDLVGLLERTQSFLDEYRSITGHGETLRITAIATTARVRVADAALDRTLERFAIALLERIERGTESYRRFFPIPHEDVIELGLDAELPSAMLVLAELDREGEEELGASLDASRASIQQAVQIGNAVLADRVEAYAALGRHRARLECWIESAEALRRTLRRRLEAIATERGLGERWVRALAPS